MPSRRKLLAALAAGLAGCGGRREPPSPETDPPPPMDYEPATPATPTPRSSPLPVDPSFSWPAPYYDAANSANPPTTGPTASPSVQWERWLPNVSRSTYALIHGEVLYVLGDDRLAVLDRRTGNLRRSVSLPVDPRTAPTLVEAGLVLSVRNEDGTNAIARIGTVGELYWKRDGGSAVLPPAVGEVSCYAPERGELVARDLEDGRVEWRHAPDEGERLVTYPAVADGTVFVLGTGGTAYAIDAATGERRWRRALGGDLSPAIATSVDQRRVFGGYEEQASGVAFERNSGAVAWRMDNATPVGVHAVADEQIVAGTTDGTVMARTAGSGARQWSVPGAVGPPIVAGETAYVRGATPEGDGERLVAFSLSDGSRRWTRPVSGGGWLLVADGYCYLNYGSGVVQCLG